MTDVAAFLTSDNLHRIKIKIEIKSHAHYLTIRLRGRHAYESTITSWKLRASNLIVLVESETNHKILHKNIEKRELEATYLKKMRNENYCYATRYLSRNR